MTWLQNSWSWYLTFQCQRPHITRVVRVLERCPISGIRATTGGGSFGNLGARNILIYFAQYPHPKTNSSPLNMGRGVPKMKPDRPLFATNFQGQAVRCREGKLHRLPTWCRFMTICLEDILWESVYNYNHGKPPVVSIVMLPLGKKKSSWYCNPQPARRYASFVAPCRASCPVTCWTMPWGYWITGRLFVT